jgi:exonuclease SbcC
VRPQKLSLEGFTSFRDRVDLDFSGLDLFAITGPTGSGKSSLIDAIVFALYGQVPRVGDDYKQLISHGAERLSVMLEFAVGRQSYRVARAARPDRPSQQRLERITEGAAEPLADRAKEIRAEVERLLGLDYDGFTRAVVLPQGQFDAFLKGEPKERRKILVALLSLGVYERMQQLANQRSTAARAEAEFLRRQLETDFASATPEALEQKRADLETAETRARQAEASLGAMAEAATLAQQARAARKERAALAKDHDAELETLKAQKDAHGFDEARHGALLAAKPRAEQLVTVDQGVSRAAKAAADRRRDLDAARSAAAREKEALPAREKAEAEAREAERAARREKEAAHREHAALALRQGLKPGDPCPVCAQPVRTVPTGEEPALEAVETTLERAEAAARAGQERLHQARLANEQRKAKAEGLARELEQAEAREREARALAADERAALVEAGFEAAAGDPAALVRSLAKELHTLEAARKAKAETDAKMKEAEQKRARLDAEAAAAAAQRDVLQARTAALRHDVQATEKALVRAAEITEKRTALEKEAALARTLADHLKAHELIAWIQEEALSRLAEAGSRHLRTLSQNRYTLRLGSGTEEAAARAEQDFFVVDAWNVDAVRSVRTLSGGETFLASLALALALAESLAELGAESRATDALESLFLDEGFGTLDSDTLDTVVSALDALHGGDRMVGIVTHVRELAERLPARVEVGRTGATATAKVV